jgi:hypothetical protein
MHRVRDPVNCGGKKNDAGNPPEKKTFFNCSFPKSEKQRDEGNPGENVNIE